jgi:DNA polymerase III gamma/tau subunit
MSLHRPETLEEVKGHDKLIQFIRERINNGTYPDATLFVAEEGLGKTTIAKLVAMALNCESNIKPCYECLACKEIRDTVIRQNKDLDYIKTIKMSMNNAEVTKEVISEMRRGFIDSKRKKVLILEECHKMNSEAQTSLLMDLEFLPKDVYVIALTTEELALQKDFKSRFVTYRLKRVKDKDLLEILKIEATRRKLKIQGGDAALKMIIPWAENKPRKALKVLEAMGENCNVTFDMLKEYTEFLSIRDIIPIISSLNGSLLVGLDTIMNLSIDYNSQLALITLLTDAVRLTCGQRPHDLSNEDNNLLREALDGVEPWRLIQLLYDIASAEKLTKQVLIAAFLRAHPQSKLIHEPNSQVLQDELQVVHTNMEESIETLSESERSGIPSIEALVRNGDIVEKW